MRSVILAAGLFAVLGLSACDSSKTDAVASSQPAAPKYFGRSQQMYQGQELISKVDAGSVALKGGGLEMTASGSVPSAGYTHAGFLRRIYAAPPKDGIYEVDVVADKPAAPATQAVTPDEVKGVWEGYPADHLKGVKFISRTNDVTAMLPAK